MITTTVYSCLSMDTVSIYFCLMFTGIFLEVIYIGIRMRGSLVSPSVSLSLAVKPLTRRATRAIFRHKMGTYELYCFVSEKAPWVWPLGSSPPPSPAASRMCITVRCVLCLRVELHGGTVGVAGAARRENWRIE